MKNRIPTPGKEGRVKITQDNGQIIEGKLEMADDPIEAGTHFAVETMLQNETAEFIGLTPDAVPDDAFRAISPQIGDFKFTLRTDLGDNWLLCNGDPLDAEKYPKLDMLISWDEAFKKSVYAERNYADLRADAICAAKDKVAFVLRWNGRSRIDVNYTIPPAAEMALTENKQVSASDVESVSGMACTPDGDAWIITAKCTGNKMAIFYATDIAGAWTRRDIDTAAGITNVVYDGTNFCFGVRYTSTYGGRNGIDIVTVSPQNMAQNANKSSVISEEAFASNPYLQYINSEYVLSGTYQNTPTLWHSIKADSNWAKSNPFTIDDGEHCGGVAYSGGKWFACISRSASNAAWVMRADSISFDGALQYATAIGGKVLMRQVSESSATIYPGGGYVSGSASSSIVTMLSLTGNAYTKNKDLQVNINSCIGFAGGLVAGLGEYNYAPKMLFLTKKLPEQSTYDQARHQYIKAK